MQTTIFRLGIRSISRLTAALSIAGMALFQPACSTLAGSQRGALLVGAETLANIAGTAAATYYGGPAAGQLASAGLSALASVLQGYVGATVPASVVQATPGVTNVGPAIANVIATNHPVTQADITTLTQAATIASTLNVSTPQK